VSDTQKWFHLHTQSIQFRRPRQMRSVSTRRPSFTPAAVTTAVSHGPQENIILITFEWKLFRRSNSRELLTETLLVLYLALFTLTPTHVGRCAYLTGYAAHTQHYHEVHDINACMFGIVTHAGQSWRSLLSSRRRL